jgi:membrane protease YdiL (CAAX protease family)
MTNIPRDHTGRPIRPTDLADLRDPTPPLSPTAEPTPEQQAAMNGDEPPQPPKPAKQAGSLGGFLAWIVIIGVVGFLFASNNHLLKPSSPHQQTTIATQEEDVAYPAPDALLELQARVSIGASLIGQDAGMENLLGDPDDVVKSLNQLAQDDPVASLRVSMAVAELVDADAASAILDSAEQLLDDADEPTVHDEQTREDIAILRAHYANPTLDVLTDNERAAFSERHGWLGQLALSFGSDDASPPRTDLLAQATRSAGIVVFAGLTVVSAFVVGFILCVLAIVFLATGTLKAAYQQPTNPTGPYAETFAIFLLSFLGIQYLSGYLLQLTGQDYTYALIWLMPLVALWPLFRGVPKKQWQHAIGWHKGKGIIREVFAGILGYLAGLPVVALGIGSTLLLMTIAPAINSALGLPDAPPSHPIAENLGNLSLFSILALYITACVWAPFVEETIFRGALYNNTRRALHPIFAALFTGLIFASIHPQGWIAIPALMSLGTVFALVREWRGSIIAPAVAHAINNGFVFSVLIFALG